MPGRIFFIIITALLVLGRSYADDDFEVQKQKADSLYELAWDYMFINPDTALYFAKRGNVIAYKLVDRVEQVYSDYTVGVAYVELNNSDSAVYYYFRGLSLLNNPNALHYKKVKVLYYQNIGMVYLRTYNYDLAFQYTLKALNLAKVINYRKSIVELIYNMGYINYKNKSYDTARYYFDKAIRLGSRIDYKSQLTKSNNMLGNVFFVRHQYDTARKYFLKALNISKGIKELEENRAIHLGNIGECCFHQNKFDSARKYYLMALPISEEFNDMKGIKWLNYNLGNLNKAEGEYDSAILYYKKCIELGNENVIDKYYKMACQKLSEVYEAKGNYKEALVYNNKYIAQLNKVEHTKRSLKQENHQFQLTQPKEVKWNTFWISLLAILTLLVIGVVLVHFYHSRKESKLE